MAVNKDPILKRCRYLGISPTVVGVDKSSKRNPGANTRKKVSEYGLQLKEKQKLKFIYGVLEKPFRHYYDLATKMEGSAGGNIITLLESRFDNVVYRMGFALTRREARQLVNHGHFTVNGKKVDIPSYRLKVGDVVELKEKSRSNAKFKENLELTASYVSPSWLDVDRDNFKATINRMPVTEDLDYEVETHLIVELYSK